MKKLAILFTMVFAINVVAQESVLLRLNYKKGETYITSVKMSQDAGTMMSMDINTKMSQKITEVSGSEYTSTMKIVSMEMNMNQGGMSVSYDSTKSDDELDETGKMMKAQMGPMLKAVVTAKGNNLGKVLDMKVDPDIPATSELKNQMNGVEYPEKAVRVGDTWKMTRTEKGVEMNFVYTVKTITSSEVLVDISGKVGGIAEGTISGNMTIDAKTGVPRKSKIDTDMTAGGQEIMISVITSVTKQ